jgi:hypothetical protein
MAEGRVRLMKTSGRRYANRVNGGEMAEGRVRLMKTSD